MNYQDVDDYFVSEKVPDPPAPGLEEDVPPPPTPSAQPSARSRSIQDRSLDVGLPANVDAEKTILGSILLDNEELKRVSLTIEPDDFSLDSHRRICLQMKELYDDGKPIDIVTLSHILAQHKEVEAVGGIAYLASLTEGLPRRPVIDEYLRIVKDKSIARRIMIISSEAIARAADQSEPAIQTLQNLDARLAELKDASRQLLLKKSQVPFFVGFRTFVESTPEEIDWTVEGIIQREGNGLILGDSGTSKSLLVFDLALHLVSGVSWFHHAIKRRVKVGLVAREDAPGLSQSRLQRLRTGASESVNMFLQGIDLNEWLYVNTRSQRETWSLQKEVDIQEIIEETKQRGIQFLFFDVFRTLWEGNENDNQETAKVLDAAKRIGRDANCQICIVHHLSKSDRGTIFDRARGGGINGWKEWGMGLSVENPDADPRDQIRKIQFHTKMACASEPIFYRIDGYEKMVRLEQVDAPVQQYESHRGRKKEDKGKPEIKQAQMPYKDDEPPF